MPESGSYEHFIKVEALRESVLRIASSLGLRQTLDALSFAERCHADQYRKGPAKLPYIIHPLTMARHALALELREDSLLAAVLLHDTCEDCGISPGDLPVSPEAREAVRLLTFSVEPEESRSAAKARYFSALLPNRIAAMTKLLDRCNNLSYMVYGFSSEKMADYISESKQYVLPILEYAKEHYREYSNALFLIDYQIYSLLNSIQVLLERAGADTLIP